jgi:taurine dioxygenase
VLESPTEPLGVTISEVSLGDADEATIDRLRHLLAEYGVVVARNQTLDDAAFTAFLRRFGDLAFTRGETPVPGHPDLNVVSNVGRDRPPRSQFHVDTSYVTAPPAYTALRAVTVPANGGQTVFSNQYRAYDTLSDTLRSRLDGRTVEHRMTGLEPGDDEQTSAEHPLFLRHPISGRTALYLSTPQRCSSISGIDADEAAELIEVLLAHSTREDNLLRHTWAEGDVVMWDNGCVMHRADHDGVVGDRVMHRGMSLGYAAAVLQPR